MRKLYRRLARFSRLDLAAAYAVCLTLATLLYLVAGETRASVQALAGFLAVIFFSLLFTVVTWYRSEEVPGAALFLALSTTAGFVLGYEVSLLLIVREGSMAALAGFGILFGLPIRILILWIVFAILVAIGRRFRSVFAPDTLRDDKIMASTSGAA